MNIIVLIKQVPDTTDVKINPKTGNLIREGIPTIMNPYDMHALEEALRIKDKSGGKVTAITMGPPQAIDVMQEALAVGADTGILLTDEAFAGADTLATAYTLGRCIEKIGKYDLIICGLQAIDGDTAQVGPQVAEYLDIAQITYVRKIHISEKKLIAERIIEDGYEIIECNLPALITVIKEINKPRYPKINKVIDACSEAADIIIWNAGDIDAAEDKTGLTGSPTQVKQIFTPEHKRKGEMLTGTPDSIAKQLLDRLRGKKLIRN
ncbi:MAG: electron transfer flavoprotein subunit beta/FixA family protein [Bacteroidia bacterium]|nr:electron transfer flavoprotein subunit beta/FixA family protein [Bacteroidia bacterium]